MKNLHLNTIKWNLDPCISPVLILLWISWYNFSQVAEYSLKLHAHRFHKSAYHPWIRRLYGIFLLSPVFSRLKESHKNILRFSTRPWFIRGWGSGGDKEAFPLQHRRCTHFVTHQDTCPDHTCKPQLLTARHCLLTKEERSHSSGYLFWSHSHNQKVKRQEGSALHMRIYQHTISIG